MSQEKRFFFQSAIIKAVDKEAKTAEFLITSDTVDRGGEMILPEGGVFENYLKSPRFLAGHNWFSLDAVLGKAISLQYIPEGISGKFEFATAENPAANMAFELVSGGFLNTVSIGFLPISWAYSVNDLSEEIKSRVLESLQRQGVDPGTVRRIYTKWELLEVSLVIVPANPDALGRARSGEYGAVAELVAKMIDLPAEPEPPEFKATEEASESGEEVVRALERVFDKHIKN